MKKVVLASFLACAVAASALPSAFAQDAPATPPAAGAPAAGAAAPDGQVQMPAAEYAVYNNAMTQTDPTAKAAAFEAYLTQYPQSAVKATVFETLMALYAGINPAKALDAADRLLQVDPTSVKAFYVETYFRGAQAGVLTDPAAKQAAYDTVVTYAQKGLAAPQPKGMSDADFATGKKTWYPTFYSAIGYDDVLKKDPGAIDAYKKELALVTPDATKTPGPILQDEFYLGAAYMQQTPPDYLNCTFYASRAVAYAPEPYKTEFAKTAKYCYKEYHGSVDAGYDAVLAAATANQDPPADFATSVKPAPTPADIIAGIIASTPDLTTLATSDKEYILENGTSDQAAKVWDVMKGKSYQFPGALVIASTPTQLQVALSDGAIQTKTADFTFNLKAPEEATGAVAKAAAMKTADAVAAASAVGQTVTLSGTFDSFTPKPLMITMSDGEVVLPKAAKATTKAPVHTVHHAAH